MDTEKLIKHLILYEINNTNNTAHLISLLMACCNSANYRLLAEFKEPDVYVNNYFEEVVPRYSDGTYRNHFRMSRNTMKLLVDEIEEVFIREHINVDRMTVSLDKKVHVTIWMLANYAVTFRECGTLFGLSTGTVHFIMMQICTAINLLKERYIRWPNDEECVQLANATFEKTSFPGVIGAIDGCHIEIKAPFHNAYDYYNRKQFHSVILQGTCNVNLQFTDIFVGVPGRVHDARVFRLSPLSRHIAHGLISPNFHILADSAYSLHANVLTPYRDNGNLTRQQVQYNVKHAGVRSCIERAFGLLKNKFRRLRYLDMSLTNEIPVVITACCVLHNFILLHEGYGFGEDTVDDLDVVQRIEQRPAEYAQGHNKRRDITNMF